MSSQNFSQKQKLTILKSAGNVGIRKAAEIAGVHYTAVYDWRRQLDALGEDTFLVHDGKCRRDYCRVAGNEKRHPELLSDRFRQNPGDLQRRRYPALSVGDKPTGTDALDRSGHQK
jgi:hypothetical protein